MTDFLGRPSTGPRDRDSVDSEHLKVSSSCVRFAACRGAGLAWAKVGARALSWSPRVGVMGALGWAVSQRLNSEALRDFAHVCANACRFEQMSGPEHPRRARRVEQGRLAAVAGDAG